jgi:hypothetical protein
MHRIDTPNRAINLWGAGKDGWRDGSMVGSILPTEFNANFLNSLQEELANVIEGAGLTLSSAFNTQLYESIQRLIDAQAGNYVLDTGAANAYVVAISPAISAYANGMTVRFRFTHTNTGASTLNAGAGVVPLVNDLGNALVAGDAPNGGVCTAIYDATLNKFLVTSLVASQVISAAGGTMTGPLNVKIITETKTAPAITAGALALDLSAGSVFDVALNANITTINITNPPAAGIPMGFTGVFTADGTARSITWPASFKWAGGTAPTLTSTAGKRDVFTFMTMDGGATYLAFVAGQNQ